MGFLQIGDYWVNLDLVKFMRVDIMDTTVFVEVYWVDGKQTSIPVKRCESYEEAKRVRRNVKEILRARLREDNSE